MTGEEFAEELYRENLYFVYEDKCKELEKELENLKKIEKEHQRINGKLREENKRLNNIINELEKWFKDMNIEKLSTFDDYDIGQYNAYKKVINKLRELKGSDKE